MTKLKDIVEQVGGTLEVARHLQVRPPTVRGWLHNGYIPELHQEDFIQLANLHSIEVTPNELDQQWND